MKLLGLKSLLEAAEDGGYAVGAFNYCNAEIVQAIIEEGTRRRSPVILIIGPLELPMLGTRTLVRLAEMAADSADIPVCLHLDHATELDQIAECIDAGFPSVMIDGSQHDFEDNIRLTRAVVEMAHPRGITVEGELGTIGKAAETTVEGGDEELMTDPAKAAEFVARTGVDALATSIGNAHGFYKKRPELDFARLQAIRRATGVPLVLHGGTGIPAEQLHRAIGLGISKVNVASEIGRAYCQTITERYGEAWYALVLADAKAAVAEVVGRWMCDLGSAGRCP